MNKNCLQCWKSFESKSNKKFCSKQCLRKFHDNALVKRVCKFCNKVFMGTRKTHYCSDGCMLSWKSEKTRQTCLQTYWVDNPAKSDLIKDKTKQTVLNKYWVKNVSLNNKIKEKIKNTNIERYWNENPQKTTEIKEKIRQTNLDKYWVPCTQQSKKVIEYYKNTFGVSAAAQIPEVKEKTKKTNESKYWVPYTCMLEECRAATVTISKPNEDFTKLLEQNDIWYELEFPISNRSYDIKVWNILIEINPFPYHNTIRNPFWTPIDKNYHLKKTLLAKDNWYKCIHIFDWDNKDKVVSLLKEKKKIGARWCEVKKITYEIAHQFLMLHHLQWDTKKDKNNIYIGLFFEDELVEVMSFWKPRYNKNYEREVLRLCSCADYIVVWWANKIFRHFLNLTKANSVISYCDMSKFDGWVYEQLWFVLQKRNAPSWHRVYSKRWEWIPFHITDNQLRQRGFDQLLWKYFGTYGKWTDNEELIIQAGYVHIYDCWQATYIRHKEKEEK